MKIDYHQFGPALLLLGIIWTVFGYFAHGTTGLTVGVILFSLGILAMTIDNENDETADVKIDD